MLKHRFIIDKLSEAQKLKILTDVRCLESEEYSKLGLPTLKLSIFEEQVSKHYPSTKSLANSWSIRTVSEVASEVALEMVADGANVALLPNTTPRLAICDSAISEDPYLSSKFTSEYLLSVAKSGMGILAEGASIDESGALSLDKSPDARLVNEFVIRPMQKALENKKCNGVLLNGDISVENYESVNSDIAEQITVADGIAFGGSYILCQNIAPEDTVNRIAKGHICLDGSETVLKAAIDRYKRLKQGIADGKVSVCELDAEIEVGSALPTEKIDEALNRVIEFAIECVRDSKGKISPRTPNATAIKNAAHESTVLLKNAGNILPFKKTTPVAIVGDIIINYNGDNYDNTASANDIINYVRNQGGVITGFYRGYSMCEDVSAVLLRELETSLQDAETVILFMGTNPKKEAEMLRSKNLYLPANQLAALHKIREMGKKIIAVVSSDLSFDVTFDSAVDALIVAPLNIIQGAEVAIDVIMGSLAPIGRLARTIYRDTELIAKKQSYYLQLPNTKVGTMVGYRYYDSAEYDVAYPFGFGLGYTRFQYSKLSVQGNDVVFTVKNRGKSTGAEVAQLYIGLKSQRGGKPKKELVGFEKVLLQPGASTTVRIPLDSLERFDKASGEWKIENGEYVIYVGSSVRNIKILGKATLGNDIFVAAEERASDYLQSETNIITESYTLEADYKRMKKNVRNIVFGTGSLCLSIAMFLFSLISGSVGIFFIGVAAILAVAGVVFFILEGSDRSKLHKIERERINDANSESFKDATVIEGFSAASVFADEFDKVGTNVRKTSAPVQRKADNYLEFVSDTLTFKSATEQFIAFAASRGFKFEENSARELFAAMSSSRLVITKGMTKDAFSSFIKVLSEYFGTATSVDVVDNTYVNDNSALYKSFGGVKQKTALASVIERSCEARERVHIAALTDVTFAEMSNYFVPFSRYIRNPRNNTVINAIGIGDEAVSFKPCENLWFFVNLRMGESLKNIPSYISELASVIKIDYSGAVPKMLTLAVEPFNYYQFDYMLEKIKNSNGIPEENWKKIDSLEAFVKNGAPFVLTNRVAVATEKFYTVFSVSGGDSKDALDRALSARILPSVIVALDGVQNIENKNLTERLEMIFGEENVEFSRSSIRASGSSVL